MANLTSVCLLLSLCASGAKVDLSSDLILHRSDKEDKLPDELPSPSLGKGDFTIAARVRCDDDSTGDLVSQYDPANRRGFHLSLKSNAVASSQANRRHLQFGDRDRAFRACQR